MMKLPTYTKLNPFASLLMESFPLFSLIIKGKEDKMFTMKSATTKALFL